MQIAVLSGKGGTGKTTVSTNLACLLGYDYADCDVEEPNGFIFLKPEITETFDVNIKNPKIDESLCIHCGKCAKACQFNALANTKNGVLLFEKLCHGCGACVYACPTNAISEIERKVGTIDIGKSNNITCIRGTLDIGEPMAGPIISVIKKQVQNNNVLVDCSPGSSCNVVKALYGADFALLVTEPSLFGLHDLKIAVELTKKLGVPRGIIINRADDDDNIIKKYCTDENIPLIGSIPFDIKAAKLYSEGRLLIEDEKFLGYFKQIEKNLKEVAACSF